MPLKSVIIVSDSASIDGGSAKVALDTASIMLRRGLNVAVFAGGSAIQQGLDDEVRVELTGDGAIGDGNRSIAKAIRGVWNSPARRQFDRLLSDYDPESTIVHVHSWGSRLSPSVFASLRKRRFATVITAHDYLLACPNSCRYVFPRQSLCNRTPGSISCIMCCCDRVDKAAKIFRLMRYYAQRIALARLRPTVAYVSDFQRARADRFARFEHAVHVIDNPVESPARILDYAGSNGAFLCVGRLEKEKGVDVFGEALRIAGAPGIVVGDGSERDSLARRFPAVSFLGWMTSEDVQTEMLSARALVIPSRWFEAAPLTPLEAQLVAALPCIVSDACAARDAVEDGVTGFIFESGNSADLARCLQMIEDPVVHAELRQNIITRHSAIRTRHAAGTYARNMIELYNAVLAESVVRQRDASCD